MKFRRFAEKFDIFAGRVEDEISKNNNTNDNVEDSMPVNDIDNIHISTGLEHNVE